MQKAPDVKNKIPRVLPGEILSLDEQCDRRSRTKALNVSTWLLM